MRLKTVTITGADSTTNQHEMADLSAEFPFVEWGILFSTSKCGIPRFPSMEWIQSLPVGLRYSAHLCGRYVRDLVLDAHFSWLDEPINHSLFQRVQLNFHGQFHRQHPGFTHAISRVDKQFILQCDGPNDEAVRSVCDLKIASPLFDTSGGAGKLPSHWPTIWPDTFCGYAGGLGPNNVMTQLQDIAVKAGNGSFWIDMERRVRTPDDGLLDMQSVRTVLAMCAPHVEPSDA